MENANRKPKRICKMHYPCTDNNGCHKLILSRNISECVMIRNRIGRKQSNKSCSITEWQVRELENIAIAAEGVETKEQAAYLDF